MTTTAMERSSHPPPHVGRRLPRNCRAGAQRSHQPVDDVRSSCDDVAGGHDHRADLRRADDRWADNRGHLAHGWADEHDPSTLAYLVLGSTRCALTLVAGTRAVSRAVR